jgi:hypothetical protein
VRLPLLDFLIAAAMLDASPMRGEASMGFVKKPNLSRGSRRKKLYRCYRSSEEYFIPYPTLASPRMGLASDIAAAIKKSFASLPDSFFIIHIVISFVSFF